MSKSAADAPKKNLLENFLGRMKLVVNAFLYVRHVTKNIGSSTIWKTKTSIRIKLGVGVAETLQSGVYRHELI